MQIETKDPIINVTNESARVMKLLTNFPVYEGCLGQYGDPYGLARDCTELGLDGLEIVWGEDDFVSVQPHPDIVVGYHLLFFSTWVDFWQGNEAALLEEFGTWDAVRHCYGADTRLELVARFRRDLQRALDFGAEYAVFHVSDVRMLEGFTYEFSHTDRQVCDCACELVNELFDGIDADIMLLVENQWWPGLTFRDPAMTQYLIDGIEYANAGIMLDTGHLMNTNTNLRSQAQAARYIQECYDAHGPLRERVLGLHLHQSLSGEYVQRTRGIIPADFKGSYEERFATSYRHILEIDRHEPWTDPVVADLVRHIGPTWVNNELSGASREQHLASVRTQLAALA
jgi:hypothetical protein